MACTFKAKKWKLAKAEHKDFMADDSMERFLFLPLNL